MLNVIFYYFYCRIIILIIIMCLLFARNRFWCQRYRNENQTVPVLHKLIFPGGDRNGINYCYTV